MYISYCFGGGFGDSHTPLLVLYIAQASERCSSLEPEEQPFGRHCKIPRFLSLNNYDGLGGFVIMFHLLQILHVSSEAGSDHPGP